MLYIGILNLQGAVSEHQRMLQQVNVSPILVNDPAQLAALDALIIPGGESTTLSHLIKRNQFTDPLLQFAKQRKGILGTCAGLILCAKYHAENRQGQTQPESLGIIDITVQRNGFGRQIDSFETTLDITSIGKQIPAIFIRAPYITKVGKTVDVLAYHEEKIVMARQNNVLVTAFHPELTTNTRVINYFITTCIN